MTTELQEALEEVDALTPGSPPVAPQRMRQPPPPPKPAPAAAPPVAAMVSHVRRRASPKDVVAMMLRECPRKCGGRPVFAERFDMASDDASFVVSCHGKTERFSVGPAWMYLSEREMADAVIDRMGELEMFKGYKL